MAVKVTKVKSAVGLWHHFQNCMLLGVLFVWKVSYLYQKVHTKALFWPYIYHYIIADQHPYIVKNRIEYNKSHLLTPDLILQSSVVSGLSG